MWIAGGYNLALGVNMVLSPAGAFEAFDLPLPELMLFVELVGLMVAVFGVGYCLVALRPLENRGVLALGLLGKTLVAIWGLGYVLLGKVPVAYLAVVFFSDIIYLLPFALILRHLQRAAAERTN
jgi:hypothetical protein